MSKANLPVSNTTGSKPSLGNKSGTRIMGSTANGKSSGKAKTLHGKENIPTSNYQDSSVKMGNTMHGVGEVPGYLKKKN
jgi:hypothetical protein